MFASVLELARDELTQAELLVAINEGGLTQDVSQAALSKGLTRLEDLGVIERTGSSRAPYRLVATEETLHLMRSAIVLARALGADQQADANLLLDTLRRQSMKLADPATESPSH